MAEIRRGKPCCALAKLQMFWHDEREGSDVGGDDLLKQAIEAPGGEAENMLYNEEAVKARYGDLDQELVAEEGGAS